MNRNIAWAASVIIAIAAGFAAGYLLRPGDARPAPVGLGGETGSTAVENNRPTDTPEPEKSPEVEDNSPGRAEKEPPAPAPSPAAGSLGDALAAIETPPIPTGDGEITGEITLEDGTPLPGVKVTSVVSRSTSGYDEAVRGAKSVEDQVRAEVETYRLIEATRRETASDAAGEFKVSRLPSLKFNFTFELEGYRFESVRGSPSHWTTPPGTKLQITAIPSVTLEVSVEMPDGSVPDNVMLTTRELVEGTPAGGSSRRGWSANYDTLPLDNGTFEVTATAGAHEEYVSDSLVVQISNGTGPETIVLRLKEQNGVVGRLIMPEFYAEAHASVNLARNLGDEAREHRDRRERALSGESRSTASAHDNFSFAIVGVEPGSYWLTVNIDSSVAHKEAIEIGTGLTRREITIRPPDRSKYVLVHVLDPDSKPLKGASISITRRFTTGSFGGSRYSRYVDGVYWVKVDDAREGSKEQGELLSVSVSVSHAAYGSKAVELAEGASEVTVQFLEPAFISVTVSGYSSHPHAKDLVVTLDKSSPGWERGGVNATGKGGWKLGPFEPGTVQVWLHLLTGDYSLPLSSTEVEAASGTTEVTLSIPPIYTFTLTKADAKKGDPASIAFTQAEQRRTLSWWGVTRYFNERGEVELGPVPAGEYQLNVDRDIMIVTVPGPARVEFKAAVFNALKVVIIDETEYMATAGFQTGDLIIGADGVEFKDRFQMWAVFRAAWGKEKAKFTVSRGGAEFEIEVEGLKNLERAEKSGKAGFLGADFDAIERK